jgi:hypothetical protein
MCSEGSYGYPWSILHQKGALNESLIVCAPAKLVFDDRYWVRSRPGGPAATPGMVSYAAESGSELIIE